MLEADLEWPRSAGPYRVAVAVRNVDSARLPHRRLQQVRLVRVGGAAVAPARPERGQPSRILASLGSIGADGRVEHRPVPRGWVRPQPHAAREQLVLGGVGRDFEQHREPPGGLLSQQPGEPVVAAGGLRADGRDARD